MSSEADKRFMALYNTVDKYAERSSEYSAKKKLFRQWLDSAAASSEDFAASFTYNTYSMEDYPNRADLEAYLHSKFFLSSLYAYKSKPYNTLSELWEVMAPTVRVAELIVHNLT